MCDIQIVYFDGINPDVVETHYEFDARTRPERNLGGLHRSQDEEKVAPF